MQVVSLNNNFKNAPALPVLQTLENAGFQCWFVGGCVRDCLRGVPPKDYDLATNATPYQVIDTFAAVAVPTIPTGISHGTITVRWQHQSYEVTTFRVDGVYDDSRHPTEVAFTQNIHDDLARRDFTINAMAWHPVHGFIDPYGGKQDLQRQQIRAVGNPAERFAEDALRMLRAIRFAGALDFTIEAHTFAAIKQQCERIRKVARERIGAELLRMLQTPTALRLCYESGLLEQYYPPVAALFDPHKGRQQNPHHIFTVGEHTLAVMSHMPSDLILRVAALCHDLGKPATRGIHPKRGHDTFYNHALASLRLCRPLLRDMCLPKEAKEQICALIEFHDYPLQATPVALKQFLCRHGLPFFEQWMQLRLGDIMGQHPDMQAPKLAHLQAIRDTYRAIAHEPYALSHLALNGTTLYDMGLRGADIGRALSHCLTTVIANPNCNTAAALQPILIRWARKNLQQDLHSTLY